MKIRITLRTFIAVTAFMAAIGLYGVMAFHVSRRTREIGIRMALGATSIDVLKVVLGQGLKLTMIGVATGVTGALALTRVLSSLLYDVTPTDPVTLILVSCVLIGVALLATTTGAVLERSVAVRIIGGAADESPVGFEPGDPLRVEPRDDRFNFPHHLRADAGRIAHGDGEVGVGLVVFELHVELRIELFDPGEFEL